MDVGESPFCPQCGADLTGRIRHHRYFIRTLSRNARHVTAAAVIFVAAVSVLLVLLSALPAPAEGPDEWPPENAIQAPDGTYIIPEKGFENIFDISFKESSDGTQMVFALKSTLVGDNQSFRWEYRDDVRATSMTITKNTPDLVWIEPSSGIWTITVFCTGGTTDAVYSSTFDYHGDTTTEYVWDHGGKTLSISYTVRVNDYDSASGTNSRRNIESLDAAKSFVDSGGSAAYLEERVWNVYSTAFGYSRGSTDYAECIMSMIDQCFLVRDDAVAHSTSVYWQSPIQTMYLGTGDTGDLSVLAASMLKAAGFDVSLVRMPDVWMVAVDDLRPSETVPMGYSTPNVAGYRLMLVDGFIGAGVVPTFYGYSNGLTFCGEKVRSPYGMIRV